MVALLLFLGIAAAETPLEVAAFPGAHAQRPSFNVDGSRLSVEANDHEQRRVALFVGAPRGPLERVEPTGRSRSDLAAGFASFTVSVVHEIAWAPPGFGDTFVYVAADSSRDYDIYLQGAGKVIASPRADGGPAWSPDGSHIAFTSARTGEGDLYLAKTAALEAEPRRLTSLATASELYPAWSRDGSKLAWVAHSRTGDNLFLLPALDASPTQLTSWPGNQLRPSFSPTADTLAFYANHPNPERFDLYIVDARVGAEPRLLREGVVPDNAGPAWTPDGADLVVVLDDDDRLDPIARVAVSSGTTRVLDLGTVGNGDLAVAAHDGGTWIAWVAQGRVGDPVRDFRRLFLSELPD